MSKSKDIAIGTAPHEAALLTPAAILHQAVANGAGIDVLEKLMAMQERWEANEARRAFDAALADAKAEIPVIVKNRPVEFESRKPGGGRTSYKHEDLAEIARTVDPILSRHGLSYRFRTTSNPNEPVSVTCIVSHRLGHAEENTLSAGRDETGNKNSIQAVGSTITYLQRYTLKAALGLAAAEDDDARTADVPALLSDEQVAEVSKLLADTGSNEGLFLKKIGLDAIAAIRANKFEDVKKIIAENAARRRTMQQVKPT